MFPLLKRSGYRKIVGGRVRFLVPMRDRPASRLEGPHLRGPRRKYLVLIFAVTGLIAFSLMLRVRGGFAYPPLFPLFEYLFPLQFGLLAGAILAALLYLFP
jgi:hypothetical protein